MTITWKRYRLKGLDEPFEVCLPVPLDGKGANPDVVLRAWRPRLLAVEIKEERNSAHDLTVPAPAAGCHTGSGR